MSAGLFSDQATVPARKAGLVGLQDVPRHGTIPHLPCVARALTATKRLSPTGGLQPGRAWLIPPVLILMLITMNAHEGTGRA